MLKSLYSPIYFAKPPSEPLKSLHDQLARYAPVRLGGSEWMATLDSSEALVADLSVCDASVGAEVSYALHKSRIPVLCLRKRGTSAVKAIEASAHPLLICCEYTDESEATSAIEMFLTPPVSAGRIFVVEGGDGAGKQTQTALLRSRLTALGYPVSTIDFPHDAAMHGVFCLLELAVHACFDSGCVHTNSPLGVLGATIEYGSLHEQLSAPHLMHRQADSHTSIWCYGRYQIGESALVRVPLRTKPLRCYAAPCVLA